MSAAVELTKIFVISLIDSLGNALDLVAAVQGNTVAVYQNVKVLGTETSIINNVEIPCVPGCVAKYFVEETVRRYLTPTQINTSAMSNLDCSNYHCVHTKDKIQIFYKI